MRGSFARLMGWRRRSRVADSPGGGQTPKRVMPAHYRLGVSHRLVSRQLPQFLFLFFDSCEWVEVEARLSKGHNHD